MAERGSTGSAIALTGRRILVAEDEYLIAEELLAVLSEAGAEPLGPASTISRALDLVTNNEGRLDAALLDVNMRGEPVWPVADALLSRGVPVVLSTGYDADGVPEPYAHLVRCQKPATAQDLTRALAAALDRHDPGR